MEGVIFDSEKKYLISCTTTKAKILAIDAIIDALIINSATAVTTGDISEYWLNDGQTQIKTVYRNPTQIATAIIAFRRIRNDLTSDLTGRVTRMVDSKNFPRNGRF